MSEPQNQIIFKRTSQLLLVLALFSFGILIFYKTLLLPLLVALFFTYLLAPTVKKLDRRLKLPRSIVVILVIATVIAAIAGAIAGIVPAVRVQVIAIARRIPAAKQYVIENLLPRLHELMDRFGYKPQFDFFEGEHSIASQFADPSMALQQLMNQTSGILGGVINVVLIPLICFFLLNDLKRIRHGIRQLIPRDLRPSVRLLRFRVNRTLRAVIKGQVTVALILGVLYMIGLSIIGLKFSIGVGVIAGICRIVPYLDVIVGGILSFIIISTDPNLTGWTLPVGIVVVFAVVQSVDGMFITPRVIGEKVGLHPGIVIASILAFGDWFGFIGILLAIPVVAIGKVLLTYALKSYRASSFFVK